MSFVLVYNTSGHTVSIARGARYIYASGWAAVDAGLVAADIAAGRLIVVDESGVDGASNPEAQAAKVALLESRAKVAPPKKSAPVKPEPEPIPEPEPVDPDEGDALL